MNTKNQALDWQNPFVDVFDRFSAFDAKNIETKGNVEALQDITIGRKVYRIWGQIPASNYIQIPKPKSELNALGLTGRYLYIEFLSQPERNFAFHFDLFITGRNPVTFTLTNMIDNAKVTKSGDLQIPFPKQIINKWVVLCLDIEYHLQNFELFPPGIFKSYKGIHILKSIKICASTSIRGIYTSDIKYDYKSLPKKMDFKLPKSGNWNDDYSFIYLPSEPINIKQEKDNKENIRKSSSPGARESSKGKIISKKEGLSQSPKQERSTSLGKKTKNDERFNMSSTIEVNNGAIGLKSRTMNQEVNILEEQEKKLDQSRLSAKNKIPWLKNNASDLGPSIIEQKYNSQANLAHVLSFSGRRCPDIKFSRHPNHQDEILYTAGSILVAYDSREGDQRFFNGHDSAISSIDISKDGSIIASAQEDKTPLVKLWNYDTAKCLNTFAVPLIEIRSLSISPNKKLLCICGKDIHNREEIIIYNIEQALLSSSKKPEITSKQVSEFSVLTCKFSPIENDKLVSCGKENIRFWRIKGDHLAGCAVVLNHHARDTVFTVLDFEFSHENPVLALNSDTSKRVFVASKHGLLFQVNYFTRELEGVYKIHNGSVCSLAVSAGFCVTGSEDKFLRVWPLDFSEYFLEAKHEGIVISLDISNDALKVVCGISSGGLGILDLSNQSYKTVLRSHTEQILQIEIQESTKNVITLSEDLTIRVWEIDKYEQLYEFTYSRDDICLCIAPLPSEPYFAAGFKSGILRIFDIEKTCIISEAKYHNTPIKCVSYSKDSKFLVSGDTLGNYNLYDITRNYQIVKIFEAEIETQNTYACFTKDSQTLATIGSYGNHINLWDLSTFYKRSTIIIKNTTAINFVFSDDDTELYVVSNDYKFRIYRARGSETYLHREVSFSGKFKLLSLRPAKNKKYLIGGCDDNTIRFWELNDTINVYTSYGHIYPVNAAILSSDQTKIISGGGDEGIFIWNFKGTVSKSPLIQEQLDTFSSLINLGIASNRTKKLEFEVDSTPMQPDSINNSILNEEIRKADNYFKKSEKLVLDYDTKITKELTHGLQSSFNQNQGLENTSDLQQQPQQRGSILLKNIPIFKKKIKFKKDLPALKGSASNRILEDIKTYKYVRTRIREKNKLPFKHYAIDHDSKPAQNKMIDIMKYKTIYNLNYLIGYNNDCHSNLVWNQKKGWVAYSVENFVIIEILNSEKKQKLLTFNDYISVLALSKDSNYLAIGAATYDEDIYSNIYIVDCFNLKVIKTLKLHNKGINCLEFSDDGKYLISAGNYRECIIGIWDYINGKLIDSSYSLSNVNQIRIKRDSIDYALEFCTVGGDQVTLWILTMEGKLINSSIFIKSQRVGEICELTAFGYIYNGRRVNGLVGNTDGEIFFIDLSSQEIELRKKISNDEIINIITNSHARKALITALDSKIITWDFSKKLKLEDDVNLHITNLLSPASNIYLDDISSSEGLIGVFDGGIYYINLIKDIFTKLVGAPSYDNPITKYCYINDDIFATIHNSNGSYKLWNIDTGEEISEFMFDKLHCTYVAYIKEQNDLAVFFNNNSIRLIDMDDFSRSDNFLLDDILINNTTNTNANNNNVNISNNSNNSNNNNQDKRYIISCQRIEETPQIIYYLLCTNLAEIYHTDFKNDEEMIFIEIYSQQQNNNAIDMIINQKWFTLSLIFDNALIKTFKFKKPNKLDPELQLIDEWYIMDNPHGDLDKDEELRKLTMEIYGSKITRKYTTCVHIPDHKDNILYSIVNYLQYVFIRDYDKKEIIKRINLTSFPVSLTYDSNLNKIMVGQDNGFIISYDDDGEEQMKQRNYLDGSIIGLKTYKHNGTLLSLSSKGICIYKQQEF